MIWDWKAAKYYFVKEHDAHNPTELKRRPQNEFWKNFYDSEAAIQKVYFLCATEALTKVSLISLLMTVVDGSRPIDTPSGINNSEHFNTAFQDECKEILCEIECGTLNFER